MQWNEALRDVTVLEWAGAADVAAVEYDSRRVGPGAAFVAMRGGTTDGNRFVDVAVAQGAAAIVTDSDEVYARLRRERPELAVARVEHGRRALAELSAAVLGHPERKLALSAVTGTNGKTTTAWLLEQMLRAAGRKTVLIGTIETHVGDEVRPSPHTTPEASDVLRIFADGVAAGATEAVMEMSSHALDQERVWGLPVDVGIFTNLTQDHLDYHGTMEQYLAAKLRLFEGVGAAAPRVAVINLDDDASFQMERAAKAAGSKVWTYGISGPYIPDGDRWDVPIHRRVADFLARHLILGASSIAFDLVTPFGEIEIDANLAGIVNVYNLLAVSCAAFARGLTLEEISKAAKLLKQVPGRFQVVPGSSEAGFTVVVDYAHTDDALRNLIGLAQELVGTNGGRVITLFGCGGDRDKTKRPKMGRAAGEGSDLVVLTSDNPRSEDPMAIIEEALAGVRETTTECVVVPDRAAAIERAIRAARPGDIVLLAGKGHEKVQEIGGEKIAFDDVAVAAAVLKEMKVKLTLGQIADWMHAEGDFATTAEAVGYSIDSRTIGAGELFFAVKGDRFDGHDFVEAALANGAVAAVVSMRWLAPDEMDATKLLRVPDHDGCGVLDSLQRLAREVRRSWGGRVIGVTGSAGKTTTKEAVAQVLSARFRVLKSQGNLNNAFGLPMQLLKLERDHEVAVIEMGMNHAGEITALAKIAEPNWAVVSNVAPVHLEFFPEGIRGIAQAKYELVEALPEDGVAVLNCDDEWVAQFGDGRFGRALGDRAVYYGTDECAAVRATEIVEMGLDGVSFVVSAYRKTARVHLRLMGRHNVLNALAAIAVGMWSGMLPKECAEAIGELRAGDKRGEIVEWRGAKVINDSYNSNPRALDAMVAALMATPVGDGGRRIVVAGEMLELGPEGSVLHRACGETMRERGVDVVIGVRGLAGALVEGAGERARFVETPEEAGEWLKENLRRGDVVLLKASRGVRLERALGVLGE